MDIDRVIEHLYACEPLPENEMEALLLKAREILIEENTVVYVSTPVTVCGDVHGQFHDVLELFRTGGELPATNYLFLGDYIDRGMASVETLSLLLAFKVKYPDRITLLRGNHECRQITQIYGFHDEVVRKYGRSHVWRLATDVFDTLPAAGVIDGQIFCVHAGLSPDLRTLDQINTLQRLREIPQHGPFADLMWSDPDESILNWNVSSRGAGWIFGERVVREFCHVNGLGLICRAHQIEAKGYRYWFSHKLVVTIWSAPNYAYRQKNVAAVIAFDEDHVGNAKTFRHDEDSHARAMENMKKKPLYFL